VKLSRSNLIALLRIVLGVLFVYAGAVKIQNPQNFADSVATFQILPFPLVSLFALGLPPFEIITGLLLMSGYQKNIASFGILILCCIFLVAISQAILRGLVIDCGCFGSSQPSPFETRKTFVRDLLLLGIAALVYREQWRTNP